MSATQLATFDERRAIRELRQTLEIFGELPEEEWQFFSGQVGSRFLTAGETLYQAGTHVDQLYWIAQGLIRCFYQLEDGQETTVDLVVGNSFLRSTSSWLHEEACRHSAAAEEPTIVLMIPTVLLSSVYQRHHSWNQLGRCVAENLLARLERREAHRLLDTPLVRLHSLMLDHADVVDRVLPDHLASYLGIKTEEVGKYVSQARATTPEHIYPSRPADKQVL